jgi:ATP-dependent DNA helicase RecG
LARLGIFTVGDLIVCYPREYRDLSSPFSVATAPYEEKCCVKATITRGAQEKRVSGNRRIYIVTAEDETARLRLIFFNNGYAAESLKVGQTYLFYGKVSGGFALREMTSPLIFTLQEGTTLQPVYPLTAGLSNKMMTTLMKNAFLGLDSPLADPLPESMRMAYDLCSLDEAVRWVHFPPNDKDMQRARRRLIFEELLVLQLALRRLKGRSRGLTAAVIEKDFLSDFWGSLPFTPTSAQRRVADEAFSDMEKGIPMNRLVQGDVGSGKTAVAAALCYTVVKNRFQCVVMAPTEILATQHYETFSKFLTPFGITVGLLTGSTKAKERKNLLAGLADGSIQVAIGTHALLEDAVQFQSLGLVVTDEQHRFGVAQRSRLAAKGEDPHLLVMSATPIPRTLAMIVYGDLDVSVIDELPAGRQKVDTYAVPSSYHARIYEYIRKFVRAGQQAYVICPLVEENEENPTSLISAEEYAKTLTSVFPEYRVGLLHGKMKPKEKEKVMQAFAANEIQILVATTVVEVGVDVPNANVMVIENAERFGLSQLHQLRGRIGRGQDAASCILVSDHKGEIAKKRLAILKGTNNGFEIADEDLKLRGPGDFFGSRQHGLPQMKLADLLTDTKELSASSHAAARLLAGDPLLTDPQHVLLAKMVDDLCKQVSAS